MSHAMQIALKAMAVKADYSTTSIHTHRPLQLVYYIEIAVTDTFQSSCLCNLNIGKFRLFLSKRYFIRSE